MGFGYTEEEQEEKEEEEEGQETEEAEEEEMKFGGRPEQRRGSERRARGGVI